MRHVVFAAVMLLYVVSIGQNWAVYTAALMIALWVRYDGRLTSIPFTVGGRRRPQPDEEEAPTVASGT